LGIPVAWDDLWLHPIVNAIARWQDARSNAAAALARLEEARERLSDLCRRLHEELSVYDGESAGDAEAMHLRIEELDRRCRDHAKALHDKTAASAARDRARRQLEDLNSRHEDLFARVGLAPGDRTTLLDWLDQKSSFDRLKSDLHAARTREEIARRPLADHPDLLDCSEQSRPAIETEI